MPSRMLVAVCRAFTPLLFLAMCWRLECPNINFVGYYIFLESSSMNAGDRTQLVSSRQTPSKDRCMTFYYHMFGAHVNTLNIYRDTTLIWSRSTNQGNVWRKGQVTLRSSSAWSSYEVSNLQKRFIPCLSRSHISSDMPVNYSVWSSHVV